MKLSGRVRVLVKLQRPPPEILIFFPMASLCSSKATLRPRFPASIAHISPAAPAPIMITSNFKALTILAGLARNLCDMIADEWRYDE